MFYRVTKMSHVNFLMPSIRAWGKEWKIMEVKILSKD